MCHTARKVLNKRMLDGVWSYPRSLPGLVKLQFSISTTTVKDSLLRIFQLRSVCSGQIIKWVFSLAF